MLKPPKPAEEPGSERPVGELVHQLLNEGKAYAQAEIKFAKTIAIAKVRALAFPSALLFAALVAAQSAITALAVGIVIALAKSVGPLLAGIIGLAIFAAGAGGLAWYGLRRIGQIL
jgi:hypothetical protein